ncbi:DNA polymerase III subunit alpha [bacterium]|nr:DNA polymerase III subunit alpha [bacterium]
MSDIPFVHLHNHSDYSLLDGAAKIKRMVAKAASFGMGALALTDHGNMFGALEFYTEAKKAGIKPVLGMESYITHGSRFTRSAEEGAGNYYHLTLLAENNTGYQNLARLSSIGFLEGFYYKPRIDLQVLGEKREGLIALSGCVKGPVADLIARGRPEEAREAARMYRDLFGPGRFYIEIMDHGIDIERRVLPELVKIAGELEIPLVATNDAHYLCREDAEAQDALVCIQTGKVLDDTKRLKFGTTELYLKSQQEMLETFRDFPDAVTRTAEVAERCNVSLEFGKYLLPEFPLPDGYDMNSYLAELAREGMKKRYPQADESVEQRLAYELDIIRQTGFPGYFLIVSDFVRESREMGVPVGPGRGSAAGSLVSYCLGITNIDPLKYNLLFERFLNPERVSMPDIDIDFADRERERVIQYVKDKYGEDNVTQIITFGTMAARAVVRDVGRVMGMPFDEVDRIAKMIPEELGITLDKALEVRPELRELGEKNPRIGKLLEISKTLEGVNRHASTHAAGVVIAPGRLTDYVPLFRSPRTNDITTQYDKDFVEKIGLLKMDFLGLRTLTVIQDALDMIKQNTGVEVDLDALPLDDPATYEIFCNGDTVGIFQFESGGMREYLRKLRPECLDDIIAMNALYRPGPLGSGMVEDFINRKHGDVAVEYLHPVLEPILKETYGVIVYQEQVMRIASEMAGFTLGGADQLRRAMGKKKKEVMDEQKGKFMAGAKEKAIDPRIADKVFELMAHFAGYGFNKSHSAGYAVLAYQTAWLKAHHPREFLASTLTSEMNNFDKLAVFLEECRRMKIGILPPDVNESGPVFTVVEGGIRFGLAAVKNAGRGAVDSLVEERRRGGPYKSLGDLIDRADSRMVNRRLLESLICAGALNSFCNRPEQLMAVLDSTVEVCQRLAAERASGQMSLFGSQEKSVPKGEDLFPPLPESFEAWAPGQDLEYEKEYLGFYISGHPLDRFGEELDAFGNTTSVTFNDPDLERQSIIRLGGMISTLRTFFDRNNKEWAVITVEDRYGSVDAFVFAEAYERHRDLVYQGSFVLVSGRYSKRPNDETGKLIADWLIALEDIRSDSAVGVEVHFKPRETDEATLKKVQAALFGHVGDNPVYLRLLEPNGEYLLRSKQITVKPVDSLLAELRALLGPSGAKLAWHPSKGAGLLASGKLENFMNARGSNGKGGGKGGNGKNGGWVKKE